MANDEQKRLVGWKTIGSHIGRDARTARRWEAERGLPVHRVPGGGSATVWADLDELDNWLKGNPEPDGEPLPLPPAANRQPTRRWVWAIAAAGLGLAAAAPYVIQTNRAAPVVNVAPYGTNSPANEQYRLANLAKEKRSVPGLFKAEALFRELTLKHPNVAAGFVGLADTNLLLREFNSLPTETAYRRAEIAAKQALAIDPKSANSMRALAFINYWSNAEMKQGLALFEKALKINPDDPQTWHWYANVLMCERREKEALAALDNAYRLNRDSSAIAADRGYALYLSGQKDQAKSVLKSLAQLDPEFSGAHYYLERIYLIEARDEAFLDAAERTATLKLQKDRLALIQKARLAYEQGGRPAMLATLINDEKARYEQDGESAMRLAMLYNAARDRQQVLGWLTRAHASREPESAALYGYIEFVPYRDDPAFKALFRTAQ